jgi:hypothetical protein
MILFVTSLRHPENAGDYGRIEQLLAQTLRSIAGQTDDDYIVIVVGNQQPSIPLPPKTHFVQVDFAPPVRVNGPHADRGGFIRDKGSKIGIGLIAGRQFAPSSVMIFDADDFVHRDLAAFVNGHPGAPGWVVADGWVYSRARNGYRRQKSFNGTCGTCYVLPYEVYAVPDHLEVTASQDEVVDAFGEVLTNTMGAHRNALSWHRSRGRILEPLPFRAAVYHVDTGENHSGKALPGLIRPWSRRLEQDFAIPSGQPLLATWLSCLSPRAVAQTTASLAFRALRRLRRGRAGAAT